MKKLIITTLSNGLPAMLLILVLLMTSCNAETSPTENETTPTAQTGSAPDEVRHFFHAWLAYCVSDEVRDSIRYIWDPTVHLTELAKERFTIAQSSMPIVEEIGIIDVAWGPALVVDYDGGRKYTAKNLMYCLETQDDAGNPVYNIGIAGTNEISHYDWFNEDLDASTQVEWAPGGKISTGTHTGILQLDGLESGGTTLFQFLSDKFAANQEMTINVAGHSLGGALTQAYSSYLQNAISHEGQNPKVQAWVYAGPTAGNKEFADSLTKQLHAYHAFNNAYDLIPHAWQADSLASLCTLYDNRQVCGKTINGNSAINGFVKFFQINARNNENHYTIPGNPEVFVGPPSAVSSSSCDHLTDGVALFWKTGDYNAVYHRLNAINQQCNAGQDISPSDFTTFFDYLTEMGYQHTTAYFKHFFSGQSQNFISDVNAAVPGAQGYLTDADNIEQGKLLIEDALNTALNSLRSNQVTDCNCD